MSTPLSKDFKRAVKQDEYAEFDFGPNNKFTVITDWEGNGDFEPDVVVNSSEGSVEKLEESIDDHLAELFSFREIEFDEANSNTSLYVFYVHNADKESVFD